MPLGLCSNFDSLRSSSVSIPTPICVPLTPVRDNTFTKQLPGRVVGGKCPVDIIVIRKRACQRLSLCGSFGDAKTDVRTWCRSRIAHERHATAHQAGRAEIITGGEEGMADVMQAVELLRRQQRTADS